MDAEVRLRPNRDAHRESMQWVSLLTNGITWYLRSSILVAPGRARIDTPRTTLGFIPVGRKRLDSELDHVTRSGLGPHLYPGRLAIGLGLLAIGGCATPRRYARWWRRGLDASPSSRSRTGTR